MKSVILCEGLTDCLFIQYYLKTVHHWQDGNSRANIKFMRWNRILKKNENNVMIGHDGSCSRLIPMLENVLKSNWMGSLEEAYRKIVIVTDRDDDNSETYFLNEMNRLISEQHGKIVDTIVNNEWCKVSFINSIEEGFTVEFLLLVIPLSENGAIETVLLDSIAQKDAYDKTIIDKSKSFVDEIDPKVLYMKRHRDKLKAWFNIYFSIRVPEDFYKERQHIFNSFPWEENAYINTVFSKLSEL